ncbi:MAG: restriction endonuclease subunit S, partial [Bacteroidales bacterium]|nr:restriction endonuclease subunit S [Bacteroidales bacterium]
MQTSQYEYLKFVRFRELDNWSARYMINRQVLFNHKFQLNKLSSFLTKGGTITTIDDNGKYKRITVKTKNGGVCLRDIVTGKNIGTKKQWLVSEGLFIISKIDARNGAMGIIPKELNGAIVTNDFPIFNIDKGSIVPQYLLLVTTTERFVEFVQKCSSGTTNRQRVDVNDFLDVKIPIPSLSDQQALVEAYNAKIKAAEEKERRAEQLNNEIEDYLLSELGIKLKGTYSQNLPESSVCAEPQVEYCVNPASSAMMKDTYHWGDEIKKEYQWLKFVRFKDVEEWGYDKIIGNNNLLLESTIYNNRKLGDLLETNPQTSFSPLK